MGYINGKDVRVVHNRKVVVKWVFDPDNGPPWREHDGHGMVSEWMPRARKSPGERPLCHNDGDHTSIIAYDWQGSLKKARAEGWGLGIDDYMKLMCERRRVPTLKQVIERAVLNDFEYLRGWCNDEWHWCGIVVQDVETGIEQSLWGIESTNEDGFHEEIISDLAEEMWDDVCKALISGDYAEQEDVA